MASEAEQRINEKILSYFTEALTDKSGDDYLEKETDDGLVTDDDLSLDDSDADPIYEEGNRVVYNEPILKILNVEKFAEGTERKNNPIK